MQNLHLGTMVPDGLLLCCSCCTQRVFQHNNFKLHNVSQRSWGKAPFLFELGCIVEGYWYVLNIPYGCVKKQLFGQPFIHIYIYICSIWMYSIVDSQQKTHHSILPKLLWKNNRLQNNPSNPGVNKLFIEMHKLCSNRRPHGAVFVNIHTTFSPYSRGVLNRHCYWKNSPWQQIPSGNLT